MKINGEVSLHRQGKREGRRQEPVKETINLLFSLGWNASVVTYRLGITGLGPQDPLQIT